MRLGCTYVLSQSMNRGLAFVARAQFWRGRAKEFAILVNRIFPTLLAAWSQQQYPCTWVKLSFIVLISKWWQKGRTFPGLLRSIYSLSWWSPIASFTWGAIEYNNAQSYNICIKAFLITSVYGIVKFFLFTSIGFLLTQKTCYICCSWLVVFIPWRSLSKRRNASEINEKAYKSSFVLLTSLLKKKKKEKKEIFVLLFILSIC